MRLLAGVAVGASEVTRAAEASWGQVTANPWLAAAPDTCRSPETLAAVHPGEALNATLRPKDASNNNCYGFSDRRGLMV